VKSAQDLLEISFTGSNKEKAMTTNFNLLMENEFSEACGLPVTG
jgi:hypothetical protein